MQGTDVVYETFLRPLVMQYEPDIEERFRNLRAKSGQLLVFYLKNFTEKGQILFLEALHYVVSKSSGSTEVASDCHYIASDKDLHDRITSSTLEI